MKRLSIIFSALFIVTMLFAACGVSQEDYDALVEENSSLQAQVESLQTRNQNLQNLIEELKTEAETETTSSTDATFAWEEIMESRENDSNKPEDIEIVSYAQTVIEDFYPNCKFPFTSTREFKIVNTNLRYKIEGTFKENKNASYQDFCMIIEFLDNKYETYNLISLQIGETTIYNQSN